MSEEAKQEQESSAPEEKPSREDAASESPPKAQEAPKPPPAPAPPSPRKEETMVKPQREGAGNFVSMMALAVAIGSLILSAFFAFTKARPRSSAKWVTEMQKTTSKELNALSTRVAGLEATAKELQALRGRAAVLNTLDLKKALVSLREVGRQTSGETSRKVEQVEGALKALIHELESKGR